MEQETHAEALTASPPRRYHQLPSRRRRLSLRAGDLSEPTHLSAVQPPKSVTSALIVFLPLPYRRLRCWQDGVPSQLRS